MGMRYFNIQNCFVQTKSNEEILEDFLKTNIKFLMWDEFFQYVVYTLDMVCVQETKSPHALIPYFCPGIFVSYSSVCNF